jgi:dTDP-glucose pyrophosphorylase
MDLTLVIMAAGIGSRYGGVKQLDGIGPSGETLMDYSIYDAINAGYKKVVFIIRKELQEAFDHHYKERFKGKIKLDYVYQDEFKIYEEHFSIERSKPWGTGHAMLSVRKVVDTPFAIINADDFYGNTAFNTMAEALSGNPDPEQLFLLGYKLSNTLSDHGTVSRGLCQVNDEGFLVDVRELTKIGKKDGGIYYEEENERLPLKPGDLVSMNFWGFMPHIFDELDQAFKDFIGKNHNNPKAEFYIPTFVDILLKAGKAKVKVLSTDEQWLGVTYREDKPIVTNGISRLVKQGHYPDRIA